MAKRNNIVGITFRMFFLPADIH